MQTVDNFSALIFKGKLYHGKSCSTDNLCHKFKPCQNDGTCIPSAGGYECQCPLGWKGKNCTDHVNPCDGKSNNFFAFESVT